MPRASSSLLPDRSIKAKDGNRTRLAIIVSHPIQYYAPLHQRLACRNDVVIKVFFTWHAAQSPIKDQGFGRTFEWDLPLTEGYESELVPNVAADPGPHHFFGLSNPTLVDRVRAWKPDAVQVTGWGWYSNLTALRALAKWGIPTLIRGDSHLLDPMPRGLRGWAKRTALRRILTWPTAFLVVGSANRAYYRALGVTEDRLFHCTHSIDVRRFAEPGDVYERQAVEWRRQLGISADTVVVLFAGKLERKKRPLELMRAVQALGDSKYVLILVGNGELETQVSGIAAADPNRFRVLPFQNQSRMPIVYRLGNLFVLPSSHGETWGLGVNEAMACGRPVLVGDRVGCASDVVHPSCGRVFDTGDPHALVRALADMTKDVEGLSDMGQAAAKRAWAFDIQRTESSLIEALGRICRR